MKITKRLLSLVLAMAMAVTMAIGAFAAGDGTITISNATKGKEYNVYKLFDATYNSDASSASYYINGNNQSDLLAAVNAATDLFTVSPTEAAAKNVITLKTGKGLSDLLTWAKANYTKGVAGTVQTPAADGSITFSGLDTGYYYVTSSLGTAVTLTNASPTANVIDKNQNPGWDTPDGNGDNGNGKYVKVNGEWKTANSEMIGKTAEFGIFAKVPMYAGTKKVDTYTITDTMDAGLALQGNVTVTLKQGTNTVPTTAYASTTTKTADGFTVTITPSEGYPVGGDVRAEITYTAKVTASATTDNENKANMTWTTKTGPDDPTPNPDKPEPSDPPEKKTDTYVYGITINKTDSSDNTKKLVATFQLQDKDGNVINVTGSGSEYKVAETGGSATFVTNDGTAKIFGLAEGEYQLVETEAPDGYAKLAAPHAVAVLKGDSKPETKITEVDDNGYANTAVDVPNSPVAPLPSTGGIGTTLFYVVGGLMVVGAAVLLVTKRRASAE